MGYPTISYELCTISLGGMFQMMVTYKVQPRKDMLNYTVLGLVISGEEHSLKAMHNLKAIMNIMVLSTVSSKVVLMRVVLAPAMLCKVALIWK